MSILETFFILFDSDAEGVKKGADEAERATSGLEETIKKTDDASTKLGDNFSDIVKGCIWCSGGAVCLWQSRQRCL